MEIPCNAKAKVIFPNEKSYVLSKGKYCFDENGIVDGQEKGVWGNVMEKER